jgi:hypothetical protein
VARELPPPRLPHLHVGLREPARADRHVHPAREGGAELRRLLDRRGQVHVGEEHVVEARGQHTAGHRRALAAVRARPEHHDRSAGPRRCRRDVAGAVGAPVVHHDDLRGLGETGDTRASVPGSRRASLYAGTTIDSPESSPPPSSFC